jgi:hypothetical protein
VKNSGDFSFRVVFRHDIVPHSPGCKKDKSVMSLANGAKQCDPTRLDKPYHHGTEVWYSMLSNKSPSYESAKENKTPIQFLFVEFQFSLCSAPIGMKIRLLPFYDKIQ